MLATMRPAAPRNGVATSGEPSVSDGPDPAGRGPPPVPGLAGADGAAADVDCPVGALVGVCSARGPEATVGAGAAAAAVTGFPAGR
jgi:hypothetical protein